MYTLKHIDIDGFWGNQRLAVDLHSDVNIFIGPNGTGKTTLINALQAVLTLDLQLLNNLSFSNIKIKLASEKKTKTLTVGKKAGEGVFDQIEYRISKESFIIPLVPRDVEYGRRLPARHQDAIASLRKRLTEVAETCWLSVYREILEEEDYELHYRGRRVDSLLNPIDARIQRLIIRLQNYQMRLQSEDSKLSYEFQRSVLYSLLYDEDFDKFDLLRESKVNFEDLKQRLIDAYEALGVLNNPTKNRINNHIEVIQKSISKWQDYMKTPSESHVDVNDVLPLSLYKRSMRIAELSTENESKKRQLFELLNQFAKTLNSFLTDKEITLDISRDGGVAIRKGDKLLNIQDLSSGEKQVFILLAETLLQEKRGAIFLADEPELSLHIVWQRQLLSAIKSLNPNAQMIVATHSPEIAGNWSRQIIDMEDILQ